MKQLNQYQGYNNQAHQDSPWWSNQTAQESADAMRYAMHQQQYYQQQAFNNQLNSAWQMQSTAAYRSDPNEGIQTLLKREEKKMIGFKCDLTLEQITFALLEGYEESASFPGHFVKWETSNATT